MEVRTVYGLFKDNTITDLGTGECIKCLTFSTLFNKINGKEGFFNLRKNEWGDWILFQEVLL